MARAKQREAWDHTSHVLAVLINANRDHKKSSPVKPEELNPFHEPVQLTRGEKESALKEQMACLKERAFKGKVVTTPPFEPANAKEIEERRRKRLTHG